MGEDISLWDRFSVDREWTKQEGSQRQEDSLLENISVNQEREDEDLTWEHLPWGGDKINEPPTMKDATSPHLGYQYCMEDAGNARHQDISKE